MELTPADEEMLAEIVAGFEPSKLKLEPLRVLPSGDPLLASLPFFLFQYFCAPWEFSRSEEEMEADAYPETEDTTGWTALKEVLGDSTLVENYHKAKLVFLQCLSQLGTTVKAR